MPVPDVYGRRGVLAGVLSAVAGSGIACAGAKRVLMLLGASTTATAAPANANIAVSATKVDLFDMLPLGALHL